MVIGRGMIATAFSDCISAKYLIFASGVSDSQEDNQNEYDREFNLLKKEMKNHSEKVLVYFSTCSVYDNDVSNSKYVLHKIKLEEYIRKHMRKYYIFRLSHVVGNTSNNTIVNFLYKNIKQNSSFNLWQKSYRNLIDISDVKKIVMYMIKKEVYSNSVINLASQHNTSILSIVKELELIQDKKACYNAIDKGSNYFIPIENIISLFEKLNIEMDVEYYKRILWKYYNDN